MTDENQPELLFSGSIAAFERRWRTCIALVRARWSSEPTKPFAAMALLAPADSMSLIECLSAIAAMGPPGEDRGKMFDSIEADLPAALAKIERERRAKEN